MMAPTLQRGRLASDALRHAVTEWTLELQGLRAHAERGHDQTTLADV